MTPSARLRDWQSLRRVQTLRLTRSQAALEQAGRAMEAAQRELRRRDAEVAEAAGAIEALHDWSRRNAAEAARLFDVYEAREQALAGRLAEARTALAVARTDLSAAEAAHADAVRLLKKAEAHTARTRKHIASVLRSAAMRADQHAAEEAWSAARLRVRG